MAEVYSKVTDVIGAENGEPDLFRKDPSSVKIQAIAVPSGSKNPHLSWLRRTVEAMPFPKRSTRKQHGFQLKRAQGEKRNLAVKSANAFLGLRMYETDYVR